MVGVRGYSYPKNLFFAHKFVIYDHLFEAFVLGSVRSCLRIT